MPASPPSRSGRSFHVALAASVLLHLVVLFAPLTSPKPSPPDSPTWLTARLAPRTALPPKVVQAPAPSTTPAPQRAPATKQSRPRITSERGATPVPAQTPEEPPKFSAAEKAEMDRFLASLEAEQPAPPRLAQRSLAFAREISRDAERMDQRDPAQGQIAIERIPGSPPVDPFSLEMYLDALVNKLNRSSAFVKHEPRRAGVRRGAARLRLNPDGTIHSFEVLNAADQQDELAYLATLVNRAAPYSPFPPDIVKSAKTMTILICIVPAIGGSDIGFTRKTDGRGC